MSREPWKKCLPCILEGYSEDDIWNIDETGCFWKTLPDKGLGQRARQCKGGEKSKQRVTVCFVVYTAGKQECPPLLSGGQQIPTALGELTNPSFLCFITWMTAEILGDVLSKINRKLGREREDQFYCFWTMPVVIQMM